MVALRYQCVDYVLRVRLTLTLITARRLHFNKAIRTTSLPYPFSSSGGVIVKHQASGADAYLQMANATTLNCSHGNS